MKKSVTFITLVSIVMLTLSYVFFPDDIFVGDNIQQAAVIQTVQQNVHLQIDDFLTRIRELNMTTIDIRTPEEYNSGHIDGAINIDFYANDFAQRLEKLDNKGGAYSIYCRSGSRSGKALSTMNKLGFTNVADLLGGYSSIK